MTITIRYNDVSEPQQYRVAENVEAEGILLGMMLCDNRQVDAISDMLDSSDFYEPVHARLYSAITSLVAAGKKATPVTLKPLFEDDEGLKEFGGVSYLARLTSDMTAMIADARDTANHIRDLAVLRRMQSGLLESALECGNFNTPDLRDMITRIAANADTALELDRDGSLAEISGADAMAQLMDSFDQPMHGVECRVIPELDRVLGPIRRKQLVLMAARPGMGKTATAVSYAVGAAMAGHGVLFVSLEMSAQELAGRVAADMCFDRSEASVPYAAIDQRRLNESDKRRLAAAASRMHALPFQIIDAGGMTTTKLNVLVKRWARRFAARGHRLDLVVVDYLQLMRPGMKCNSRVEAIGEVSQSLKTIAKDHDLGVLALAQLSREVERRPDKRPILADLRDSGQLEQDADSVLFLLRPEYYLEQERPDEMSPKFIDWQTSMEEAKNRIEFIAAKRRNGRTGIGIGEFHAAYQAVR